MSRKGQARSLSPEYVLLGLLNQQPAHGYDLHERIARELGQLWTISLSQTYNILNRLETRGMIVSTTQAQGKAPARNVYRVQPSGKRHLEDWLRQPTRASAHAIRVEFLTRLYFAAPEQIDGLVEAQVADTSIALAHLQAILADLPPDQVFNELGLELRICQLTSILVWLADCRATLCRRKSQPAK